MKTNAEDETGCQHEYWCGQPLGDWIPGECKKCGQKVEFPFDGIGEKRIISPGNIKEGGELNKKQGRKKFYDENKEAILADLTELGNKATAEKWDMPGSTLVGLKRRWGMPVEKRGGRRKTREKPSQDSASQALRDGLPPFPAFSENWAPEVQAKWLEVYPNLSS